MMNISDLFYRCRNYFAHYTGVLETSTRSDRAGGEEILSTSTPVTQPEDTDPCP